MIDTSLKRKKILLLNSYGQNHVWVKEIVNAVEEEFQPELNNIHLNIENMDTRIFNSKEYLESLFQNYKVKYKNWQPDLILSSDDYAFEFLLRYKDKIFPDAPVVFCGVNHFKNQFLTDRSDFTGVVEQISIVDTAQLMLKLHPKTKKIFFFNDFSSISNQDPRNHLLAKLKKFNLAEKFQLIGINELEKGLAEANRPDSNSLILLGSYPPLDTLGNNYIASEKSIPVYSLYSLYMNGNVVGGKMIDSYFEGKIMAKIGKKILAGKSPSEIKIRKDEHNRYIFDREKIDQLKIRHLIPNDSILVNNEISFLEENKILIFSAILTCLFLIAINIGLSVSIEQKEVAERKLKDSENRLRNLISNIPGVVYKMLPVNNWQVDFLSKSSEKLTGFKYSDFTDSKLNPKYLLHPEETKIYKKKKHIRMFPEFYLEQTLSEEYRIINAKGETRWVLEQGKITRDENLDVVIDGILFDITDKKEATEELEKTKAYLDSIYQYLPFILIGVDAAGKILNMNQKTEEVTGVLLEEAREKDFGFLFPELADCLVDLDQVIAESETRCYEKMSVNIEGNELILNIFISPLNINENEAIIRIEDVTNQVRMEEMMIQSEKMMSVGGLAAGMAHEINNPLSIIISGIQNSIRRISPDVKKNIKQAEECGTDIQSINEYLKKREVLNYMEGVREAGIRSSNIVANMLNFSRQTQTLMTPVIIEDIVNNTIELARKDYSLKSGYDFRHIKIIKDYQINLPLLNCVQTEIEQVILNLLKNAAHAMIEKKQKKPFYQPTINLRVSLSNKNKMVLNVEDNGPGMSEDLRKRIFEPFFTTKQVGMGTGLGLSVSYLITNNHKGAISVDSTPGEGTNFTIELPLA